MVYDTGPDLVITDDLPVHDWLAPQGPLDDYRQYCAADPRTVPCASVASQRTCTIEVRRGYDGALLASAPISFGPWCDDLTLNARAAGRTTVNAMPCSDPEGRQIRVDVVTAPKLGALGLPDGSGRRYYMPGPRGGVDTFQFKASNGVRDSNVATATIDVPEDVVAPSVSIRSTALKMTRRGKVTVKLGCPADERSACAGSVVISTAKRVRVGGERRVVQLARARFAADPGQRTAVRIRVRRRMQRLVQQLSRLPVQIAVTARDAARNEAASSRLARLTGPKR
jgi:hypothetical protein